MVRIIIVDDQPLVRSGIAMLVGAEDDLEVVGQGQDGAEAVALAVELAPDVVLMDVRMPGTDGVAATRELVERGIAGAGADRSRILMLSTYNDEAVDEALRAGAAGFVLKDAAPEELVIAIRRVAAGDAWLDPVITRRLLDELSRRGPGGSVTIRDIGHLTPREHEVFVLIGHGLTNAELAEHLFVGEATVKTHVQRIMFKLNLRDRVQVVIAAWSAGLVTPGAPLPSADPESGDLSAPA